MDFVTVEILTESEETSLNIEPTSLNEEPTSLDGEPTSLSEEPTKLDGEPTSLDGEPTSLSEEPTSLNGKLTSLDGEPTNFTEEPAVAIEIINNSKKGDLAIDTVVIRAESQPNDQDPVAGKSAKIESLRKGAQRRKRDKTQNNLNEPLQSIDKEDTHEEDYELAKKIPKRKSASLATCNNKTSINCIHCQKVFKSKAKYRTHLLEAHDLELVEEESEISTTKKGEKNGTAKPSNLHDKSDNSDNESLGPTSCTKERPTNRSATDRFFKCEFCGKEYKQAVRLTEHRRTHTGEKPFKCEECGKSFSRKGSLNDHLRIHTGEKPYACDVCGKQFSVQSTCRQHKHHHHTSTEFQCPSCPEKQDSIVEHKKHLKIHEEEQKYKCRYCGKWLGTVVALKRHEKTHQSKDSGEDPGDDPNNKSFQCKECGKSFSHLYILDRHCLRHTDKKEHKCVFCNRGFHQKSDLQRHALTHSDEKPFQCDVCHKSFRRKDSLKCHSETHERRKTGQQVPTTDEDKPFNCDVCGKRFLFESSLVRHAKAHKGNQKTFQCQVCDRTFTQSCDLARHVRSHTGEKPFTCDICGRGFGRADTLKVHTRRHRNDTNTLTSSFEPTMMIERNRVQIQGDKTQNGNESKLNDPNRNLLNPSLASATNVGSLKDGLDNHSQSDVRPTGMAVKENPPPSTIEAEGGASLPTNNKFGVSAEINLTPSDHDEDVSLNFEVEINEEQR